MGFQCINIRQVHREVLKTAASGLGFQHLPQDLANVNAWKTMFDPYIKVHDCFQLYIPLFSWEVFDNVHNKLISGLRNWYNQIHIKFSTSEGKTGKYN